MSALITLALAYSFAVVECTKLSATEVDDMLTAHNDYRANVSPSASDMIELQWSSELEQVASDYVDQCVWGHNGDRTTQQSAFSSVGENIYMATGSSVTLTNAAKSWHSEVSDYTYSSNSCSAVCGHYTQVVWADTTHVGCGYAKCPTLTIGDKDYTDATFVVCNYGPAGNFNGQSPYTSGSSCAACPADTSCVNNLCSSADTGGSDSGDSSSTETDTSVDGGDTGDENAGSEDIESVVKTGTNKLKVKNKVCRDKIKKCDKLVAVNKNICKKKFGRQKCKKTCNKCQ